MEKLEKDVVKRIEKELGKGVTWGANYAVLGPYDYLDICEAPDIEAAMKIPRYGRQPSGSGSRRSSAVCRGWRLTAVISQRDERGFGGLSLRR